MQSGGGETPETMPAVRIAHTLGAIGVTMFLQVRARSLVRERLLDGAREACEKPLTQRHDKTARALYAGEMNSAK